MVKAWLKQNRARNIITKKQSTLHDPGGKGIFVAEIQMAPDHDKPQKVNRNGGMRSNEKLNSTLD